MLKVHLEVAQRKVEAVLLALMETSGFLPCWIQSPALTPWSLHYLTGKKGQTGPGVFVIVRAKSHRFSHRFLPSEAEVGLSALASVSSDGNVSEKREWTALPARVCCLLRRATIAEEMDCSVQ